MSFGPSGALQSAVFQQLQGDPELTAIVGARVFDEMPPGPIDGTYVSIGDGDVRDVSDASGGLADHRFTITVVSDAEGYAEAKAAASAVTDALLISELTLTRGRVVVISFRRARARRVRSGQVRRIDLTFHAIVEDD